jgi:hypothetical protein
MLQTILHQLLHLLQKHISQVLLFILVAIKKKKKI